MKKSAALIGLAWLGLTTPLLADDTIIVTGLKTQTQSDDLPGQIDILSQEDLQAYAHQTLNEALITLPGLTLVQSGPAGSQTSLFVRGSDSNHTLSLYDGIRINDASTANGSFNFGSELTADIDRIEFIRGPLTAIHGSDGIGGVINIIPQNGPDLGWASDIDLSWGEFNTRQANISAGYGAEAWRAHLTVQSLETDGYNVTPSRMTLSGDEHDGASMKALTLNAQTKLSDQLWLDLLLRGRNSEVAFDSFSAGPKFSQRGDDPDLYTHDDQQLWAMRLRADEWFNGLTSRFRLGQVLYDVEAFNNRALTDTYESTRDFVDWNNRWQARDNTLLSFGAEWREETIITDTLFDNPLEKSETVASAYLGLQATLSENLVLTGTTRFDHYDGFDNPFTTSLGAVYRLNPFNTRIYASWGQSFKAPTLYQRFASSSFVIPNPDLIPEEAETLELGFETSTPVTGLELGLSWYDSRVENLIENVFNFTSYKGTNKNIGLADLSGYEAFVDWKLNDMISLAIDYTYTDAVNAKTGRALLRRPEHAASARVNWQASDRFSHSLNWRYVGTRLDVTYNDTGNFVSSSGSVPSYDILDYSGVMALNEQGELYLSIRNLTDEVYEQPAAFAGAPQAITLGIRWTH